MGQWEIVLKGQTSFPRNADAKLFSIFLSLSFIPHHSCYDVLRFSLVRFNSGVQSSPSGRGWVCFVLLVRELVRFLCKNSCFSRSIDGEVKGQNKSRFLDMSDPGADLEKGFPRVAPDGGGQGEVRLPGGGQPSLPGQPCSATRRHHGSPQTHRKAFPSGRLAAP